MKITVNLNLSVNDLHPKANRNYLSYLFTLCDLPAAIAFHVQALHFSVICLHLDQNNTTVQHCNAISIPIIPGHKTKGSETRLQIGSAFLTMQIFAAGNQAHFISQLKIF